MRLLIIGGTGLISTPMSRLLIERGDSVVLYNRAKRRPDLPAGVSRMVKSRTDPERFVAPLQAYGEAEVGSQIYGTVGTSTGAMSRASLAKFSASHCGFVADGTPTVTLKPHALLTSGAVR